MVAAAVNAVSAVAEAARIAGKPTAVGGQDQMPPPVAGRGHGRNLLDWLGVKKGLWKNQPTEICE
jgi:hypothetical protein